MNMFRDFVKEVVRLPLTVAEAIGEVLEEVVDPKPKK